jgi:hypothetical protein
VSEIQGWQGVSDSALVSPSNNIIDRVLENIGGTIRECVCCAVTIGCAVSLEYAFENSGSRYEYCVLQLHN